MNLVIFVAVALTLMVIAFVVILMIVNRKESSSDECPLKCGPGQVCQRGECKSQIGGPCNHISDCENPSTHCFEGKCVRKVSTVLQPCSENNQCLDSLTCFRGLCRVPLTETCSSDEQCITGAICDQVCRLLPSTQQLCTPSGRCGPGLSCSGSLLFEEGIRFKAFEHLIIDLTFEESSMIIVFPNRQLNVYQGKSYRPVFSTEQLSRIWVYQKEVYGLVNGLIHRRKNPRDTPTWEWERIDGFPQKVVNVSVVGDDSKIWIQTKKAGFLFEGNKEIEKVTERTRRVYGSTDLTYLEWIDSKTAKLYPIGKVQTEITDGVIRENGAVVKSPGGNVTGIRIYKGRVWYWTGKICL